jgi:DNA modification methylase
MDNLKILCGDSLEVLKTLPDQSVNCCVTSPPYYALRDYGVSGQIGQEQTPEDYINNLVLLFREVRRVLRDDGTLWLNIGDSYNGSGKGAMGDGSAAGGGKQKTNKGTQIGNFKKTDVSGLKSKDLIGIPWMLANALRDPYYTGVIKNKLDRVWLAAMVDAEGSICGTEYETNGFQKTNIYLSVTNTSLPIINKCEKLFPQEVKHIYEKNNSTSNRICYRWDIERIEQKSLFIREIYPFLVAKRKQAILAYTFIEMQRGLISKKKGYLKDQQEQRSLIMRFLSLLNKGTDVELPDWVIEPPSLYEEGYYLRQDIIWHKPNPMPESVTDRCTKAHEYMFLLSKSSKYYFDNEAIKVPSKQDWGTRDRTKGKYHNEGTGLQPHSGLTKSYPMANKRSVWSVTTKPYKGAHFAVFPPALIEPCIKAGCPDDGTVLDPFGGSGTTGQVALEQGKKAILIELNPEYIPLIEKRCEQRMLTI